MLATISRSSFIVGLFALNFLSGTAQAGYLPSGLRLTFLAQDLVSSPIEYSPQEWAGLAIDHGNRPMILVETGDASRKYQLIAVEFTDPATGISVPLNLASKGGLLGWNPDDLMQELSLAGAWESPVFKWLPEGLGNAASKNSPGEGSGFNLLNPGSNNKPDPNGNRPSGPNGFQDGALILADSHAPVPPSALLLGLGAVGLFWRRRR